MPVRPAPQRPKYRPLRRPSSPSGTLLDPDGLPDETDLTRIRVRMAAARQQQQRAHVPH